MNELLAIYGPRDLSDIIYPLTQIVHLKVSDSSARPVLLALVSDQLTHYRCVWLSVHHTN